MVESEQSLGYSLPPEGVHKSLPSERKTVFLLTFKGIIVS